MHLSRQ